MYIDTCIRMIILTVIFVIALCHNITILYVFKTKKDIRIVIQLTKKSEFVLAYEFDANHESVHVTGEMYKDTE